MATFRIPAKWRDLDRETRTEDRWPTNNARIQALWRLRHPEQECCQQRLSRWKRRRIRRGVEAAGRAP